jgi:hypothetical protein
MYLLLLVRPGIYSLAPPKPTPTSSYAPVANISIT